MQSGQKTGSVYKRIRVMESESEGESPVKKAVLELDPATKERRLRNMIQMFPDISTLVCSKDFIIFLFYYIYIVA